MKTLQRVARAAFAVVLFSTAASAQMVNFGLVMVGNIKDSSVVISNNTNGTYAGTSSSIMPQPSDFSILDGDVPFLIAPYQAHKIIMMFIPSYPGLRDDTLIIDGSFPNHPSKIILRGTGFILPVELQSFSGIADRGGVMLRWTTASETNNAGFVIQRSADPDRGAWENRGYVGGSGTTKARHDYAYTDPLGATDVTGKTIYYRLHQCDMDGHTEDSRILSVPVGSPSVLALHSFPNPFHGAAVMEYAVLEAGHVTLTVHSVTGETIATLVDRQQNAGVYSFAWQAPVIPAGTYLCTLRSNTGSVSVMLIRK